MITGALSLSTPPKQGTANFLNMKVAHFFSCPNPNPNPNPNTNPNPIFFQAGGWDRSRLYHGGMVDFAVKCTLKVAWEAIQLFAAAWMLQGISHVLSKGLPRFLKNSVVEQLVFAPVLEELAFRFLIQDGLKLTLRKNLICVHLTAGLFGLCHAYSGYGTLFYRIKNAAYAYLGGVVYGEVKERHSIAAAVVVHGLYNATTLACARCWGIHSPWVAGAQLVYLVLCRVTFFSSHSLRGEFF